MKKFLILAVLLAAGCIATAEGYKALTFTVDSVNTNTTAKTVTFTGVSGRPLAFSYAGDTNMVVDVSTVVGYGVSMHEAKGIYVNTNAVISYQTNIASTIYLWNDRVVFSAHSASTNGMNVVGKLLLLEE